MSRPPGTLIVLNGTSSAGKTTLLHELQQALAGPYLEAGLDKFLWMLPRRYLAPPLWNDVLGEAVRAGDTGHRLVSGMHHAIAALSRAGSHVVADHVLVDARWLDECRALFGGLPTLFVGVLCPLPALAERERSRADRTLGQAAAQLGLVHAAARYDLTVDTSRLNPAQCAAAVAAHLAAQGPNFAFGSGPVSA